MATAPRDSSLAARGLATPVARGSERASHGE